MKIYLASSWRNPHQPLTVDILRAAGHEVYDFRHPPGGDHLGFSWSDVDLRWTEWTADQYIEGLGHPIAEAGFQSDFDAMKWAEVTILLLPCGKSAHLEAGWAAGQGKPVIVLLDEAEFGGGASHSNSELMYKIADAIVTDIGQVLDLIAPGGRVERSYNGWREVDRLISP